MNAGPGRLNARMSDVFHEDGSDGDQVDWQPTFDAPWWYYDLRHDASFKEDDGRDKFFEAAHVSHERLLASRPRPKRLIPEIGDDEEEEDVGLRNSLLGVRDGCYGSLARPGSLAAVVLPVPQVNLNLDDAPGGAVATTPGSVSRRPTQGRGQQEESLDDLEVATVVRRRGPTGTVLRRPALRQSVAQDPLEPGSQGEAFSKPTSSPPYGKRPRRESDASGGERKTLAVRRATGDRQACGLRLAGPARILQGGGDQDTSAGDTAPHLSLLDELSRAGDGPPPALSSRRRSTAFGKRIPGRVPAPPDASALRRTADGDEDLKALLASHNARIERARQSRREEAKRKGRTGVAPGPRVASRPTTKGAPASQAPPIAQRTTELPQATGGTSLRSRPRRRSTAVPKAAAAVADVVDVDVDEELLKMVRKHNSKFAPKPVSADLLHPLGDALDQCLRRPLVCHVQEYEPRHHSVRAVKEWEAKHGRRYAASLVSWRWWR